MVNYKCIKCGRNFNQKSHWIWHTEHKKYPCEQIDIIPPEIPPNPHFSLSNFTPIPPDFFSKQKSIKTTNHTKPIKTQKMTKNNKNDSGEELQPNEQKNKQENSNNLMEQTKLTKSTKSTKSICCEYCYKSFTRQDNLKRHISNGKCEIMRLQKQQKENIFTNLIEEEKIITQTKNEFVEMNSNMNTNQLGFLIKQIELLNQKLEKQQLENEKQKIESEKQKNETEKKLSFITDKYTELEKNNTELKKTNEKLQTRINKIVNKNKIINLDSDTKLGVEINTNSNNITTSNTIINNPTIKLVNFGSEDLSKISHEVFIDTIKTQGANLYNKAIDGIYFNKNYPENQNIYISDINRGKVMIYKDEKWFLDNWDNIFPTLLEKVIKFGYDKNEFLKDCGYCIGGKKFNSQMIRNGIRWYKLLDSDESDVEYFTLEPENRPIIDENTYKDYMEMQEFRKKHSKIEIEQHVKNKIKLNMYNKRDIPISNYKQMEYIDNTKNLTIEDNTI